MEVSIIVRFYNEEPYIGAVMHALSEQTFPADEYEIIGVDNRSTDRSREIAERYANVMVDIDDYQAGIALNKAITKSRGKYIAIISAHAIPSGRTWLSLLYRHMSNGSVAAVYGAQLYPIDAHFLDKRDLDIFSAITPRVEAKDSDLWNANSMIRRSLWERQPFEETDCELEDHYWTKCVLPMGYEVHYEPEALVYHYGHMRRVDRVTPLGGNLNDQQHIHEAIGQLDDPTSSWATIMRAGLVLSSLTHCDDIISAIDSLGKRLITHEDFDVRWRMALTLGKIRDPRSVPYLIQALFDSSFYPRDEAAWALARLGSLCVAPLLEGIHSFPAEIRPFVALSLARSGDIGAADAATQLLVTELRSGDSKRQRDAAYFAGEIAEFSIPEALVMELQDHIQSQHDEVAAVCCWAVGSFAARYGRQIEWGVISRLANEHNNVLVRCEATVALGKLALANAENGLVEAINGCLQDSESRVRYVAAQSLRTLLESGIALKAITHADHSESDYGVMFELDQINRPIRR